MRLSTTRQSPYLSFHADGLTVTYSGRANHVADVGCAVSACPLGVSSSVQPHRPRTSLEGPVAYFEVSVLDNAEAFPTATIGLVPVDADLCMQPGQGEDTGWGFRGGRKYHGELHGEEYGEGVGPGDVLGCGLNVATREVFFTKNGQQLGVAFRGVTGPVLAAASLHAPGETITFNFDGPFRFDVAQLSASHAAATEAHITSQALDSGEVAAVVKEHLLHSAFIETLASMERSLGRRSPVSSPTLRAPTAMDSSAGEDGGEAEDDGAGGGTCGGTGGGEAGAPKWWQPGAFQAMQLLTGLRVLPPSDDRPPPPRAVPQFGGATATAGAAAAPQRLPPSPLFPRGTGSGGGGGGGGGGGPGPVLDHTQSSSLFASHSMAMLGNQLLSESKDDTTARETKSGEPMDDLQSGDGRGAGCSDVPAAPEPESAVLITANGRRRIVVPPRVLVTTVNGGGVGGGAGAGAGAGGGAGVGAGAGAGSGTSAAGIHPLVVSPVLVPTAPARPVSPTTLDMGGPDGFDLDDDFEDEEAVGEEEEEEEDDDDVDDDVDDGHDGEHDECGEDPNPASLTALPLWPSAPQHLLTHTDLFHIKRDTAVFRHRLRKLILAGRSVEAHSTVRSRAPFVLSEATDAAELLKLRLTCQGVADIVGRGRPKAALRRAQAVFPTVAKHLQSHKWVTEVMGLFVYSRPASSPVGHWVTAAGRDATAELLNARILDYAVRLRAETVFLDLNSLGSMRMHTDGQDGESADNSDDEDEELDSEDGGHGDGSPARSPGRRRLPSESLASLLGSWPSLHRLFSSFNPARRRLVAATAAAARSPPRAGHGVSVPDSSPSPAASATPPSSPLPPDIMTARKQVLANAFHALVGSAPPAPAPAPSPSATPATQAAGALSPVVSPIAQQPASRLSELPPPPPSPAPRALSAAPSAVPWSVLETLTRQLVVTHAAVLAPGTRSLTPAAALPGYSG